MTPEGAERELKDIHKLGPFYKYIKQVNGVWHSCDEGGCWRRDVSMRDFLHFYNKIDSQVETPEEKACLDAIEMKRACNIAVCHT